MKKNQRDFFWPALIFFFCFLSLFHAEVPIKIFYILFLYLGFEINFLWSCSGWILSLGNLLHKKSSQPLLKQSAFLGAVTGTGLLITLLVSPYRTLSAYEAWKQNQILKGELLLFTIQVSWFLLALISHLRLQRARRNSPSP